MRHCLFIFILISSSIATAYKDTPQVRICGLTGGFFRIMELSQYHHVGFCQYNEALIEAPTVWTLTTFKINTGATDAAQTAAYNSCEAADAVEVNARDLKNRNETFRLCRFWDDSYLELETLRAGPANNVELVQALKMKFKSPLPSVKQERE